MLRWKWTDSPRANIVLLCLALSFGRMADRMTDHALTLSGGTGYLIGLALRMAVAAAVAALVMALGLSAYENVYAPPPSP